MTKTASETSIPFRIAYPDTGKSGDAYDVDFQTPSGSRVDCLLVGSTLSGLLIYDQKMPKVAIRTK